MTKVIIFRNKNQHINNVNLKIKIDQIVIDEVDKTKFHGLSIYNYK